MFYRLFFKAAILLAFVSGLQASDLQECASKNLGCDFYRCVDKEMPCGDDGYLLGFGERFCLRFDNILDNLSPQGKTWFFTARQCLTEKILTLDKSSSCHEIEEKSYSDHKPCYIESGYCDLSVKDKAFIMKVISPLLMKKKVLSVGMDVQLNCMKISRERVIDPNAEKEMP